MSKQGLHLDGLTWIVAAVATIFLGSAVLVVISMFFPYDPSQKARSFCDYALPPILFVLLVGPGLVRNLRARRDPTGETKAYEGNWLKPVLAGALLAIAWGIVMAVVPAIPAKYFAQKKVAIPVTVDSTDGFLGEYDYFTWIHFERDGVASKFMWTRADPLLPTLKHGDCIELHGREWSLGLYVDSISRSSACQSSNAAESAQIPAHEHDT